MLKEADPIFTRMTPTTKKRNPPAFMASTNSRFDQRVHSEYDPGMRDNNYQRWNVPKFGVLEYMRDNQQTFMNKPE